MCGLRERVADVWVAREGGWCVGMCMQYIVHLQSSVATIGDDDEWMMNEPGILAENSIFFICSKTFKNDSLSLSKVFLSAAS